MRYLKVRGFGGCDVSESLKMEALVDDDFGELYAIDVEVPKEDEEEKLDVNSNCIRLEQEKNNESVNDDCVASDSDDDDDGLKIVLNDEDFSVGVGVVDCDEDGDGDQGGDNGSRVFHPKCVKSRGSMFVNNVKVNSSMGTASYISSLNKGRWNGDTGIQNLASSSSQCGYGSFLPWYWGIFDVNIDTLMEKPWKVPGVDITDYFNFGFDDRTWKLYCVSLEQLWRKSLQTGISVDDSAKWNQEAMREQTDQVASGNVLFHSSACELPKGRAIQVEGSTVERQPSIDVRRPRNRDSNIIEIKLVESSDDYSGSGNSTLLDGSIEGESLLGNNRNILNSSSEGDEVLSEDQLEDGKKSEDSSAQKRSGLIPGVDGHEHQDGACQHSEDTAEVAVGEIKPEEGGGIDTCSSYPCWIESELSLGDQEHSLTSYTDSDYEETENSVHVNNDKGLSPLRRKSLNSATDMKESSPLYCKNTKNNSFNRKAVNVAYISRTRGPFRKEWRYQSDRNEPGYNLNKHIRYDDDFSSIPRSSARDLSLSGHQFVDYDRHKQLPLFGSHKRDVSYNRETKKSYYYGGEKVVDDLVTQCSKYYREDRESFRDNLNRNDRRKGDVGGYFFKPGPRIADSERDWYHLGWGYSSDDLSPPSYRESRQFFPKHTSFLDKGSNTQRRRMEDKFYFVDRNSINDFDECEFEFLNKSYRMSASAADREMESLDNKHEEQFPHIDSDWKRSVRRKRHCDRPPFVLNNLCSGKMEDNCQKYTHYQDSVRIYAYGARVNKNPGGCKRHKHARDNSDSNWSGDYSDAAEDDDFTIYPVEDFQFCRSPSKFLKWTRDEIICRHHETDSTSLHAKVQCDDMKLQWHQLNMPRRDNMKYLKYGSKTMCRSKGGQAVLRYRKSVDFINGEGKFHGKSSRVLYNGRLEYVDQGIAKKQRASVGFDESHKKASKFNTLEYQSSHENERCIQNLPDQGQKESSDIEEGQIVTEEPCIEACVSRRDVYEGAAVTASVKKRMSKNQNSSDQFIGNFDSQRILDSLAKMEKRRERFKQPIAMKKEAEESLKLNNDSVVDTAEMKQHRPARKRRWVGN
ncbi:uncharacterized protein LOC113871598 [Abrus precatorius]|uniref:Uncharacterized protein LOC113871598 n=1 Tax=Abrus precatorius TaxID=3816 RepID=A0A8B8M744_ABRPR|nr:uncharacterized protein LOC113871598 [Abrus precatorius]